MEKGFTYTAMYYDLYLELGYISVKMCISAARIMLWKN